MRMLPLCVLAALLCCSLCSTVGRIRNGLGIVPGYAAQFGRVCQRRASKRPSCDGCSDVSLCMNPLCGWLAIRCFIKAHYILG